MKNIFRSLSVAALCCSFSASALDATSAQAELKKISGGLSFERIERGNSGGSGTPKARAKGTESWYYVALPIKVEGKAKGSDNPHFIPELKVKATFLLSLDDKKEGCAFVQKEITYVDIPLDEKGKDYSSGEFRAMFFISPADAYKIATKEGNVTKRIVAVALEFDFMGKDVLKKDGGHQFQVFDSSHPVAKSLNAGWWKSSKGTSRGVKLRSIADTPYAAQFFTTYGCPATLPMYGPSENTAAPASGSSSDSEE